MREGKRVPEAKSQQQKRSHSIPVEVECAVECAVNCEYSVTAIAYYVYIAFFKYFEYKCPSTAWKYSLQEFELLYQTT